MTYTTPNSGFERPTFGLVFNSKINEIITEFEKETLNSMEQIKFMQLDLFTSFFDNLLMIYPKYHLSIVMILSGHLTKLKINAFLGM